MAVAIIIMVTILVTIMLLIKYNNQEQSKTEDINKNETKVEMSEVDTSRGKFTQIESYANAYNFRIEKNNRNLNSQHNCWLFKMELLYYFYLNKFIL